MTVSWVPSCVLGSRGYAVQLDSLGPPGACGPMKVADVYAPTSHQATHVRRGTEECAELLPGGRGCCGEGFPAEMQKGKGKHQPGAQVDIIPMSPGHWGLKEDHALLAGSWGLLCLVNPNAS